MKLNILFIINGLGFSKNTGIGGSDKRAIEIVRNAKLLYPSSNFDIMTTESGYAIFSQQEKLETNYNIIKRPKWWPRIFEKTLLGRLFSYFYCTIFATHKIINLKKYDIVFSTSDFFFDIIPATISKTVNHQKIVAMIHHHIASPLKRKGDLLVNIFNFLSQQFSYWWIKNNFDSVFLYNTQEGRHISHLLLGSKKITFYFTENGIDREKIDNVKSKFKKYDACFVGGIRYSKGILDILNIWEIVIKNFPKSKIAIVGGGSNEIIKKFKSEIIIRNLTKNVYLTGPQSNQETISIMKQSKIFLFPSHEEGWGIALNEALYCGLPTVCYNLPAFSIFKKFLYTSKIGHWQKLASHMIKLLNSNVNKSKSTQSIKFASKFNWKSITVKDINFINSINRG
ncbi:MAG: glycosyltransferase [Candidatus Shapirobacteria bacterium]|jgi:glycosyltransferase involved in cell wall biosynthesis